MSKACRHRTTKTALFALTLLFVGMQPAYAITGTITGDADETLVISGCDSGEGFTHFSLSLRTGRKWRMVVDSGYAFSGSFTSDSGQRNIVLSFDSASESRFVNLERRNASSLCNTTVRITSHSNPVAKLRFNANFTSVSGTLTMKATGKTDFGSGSARYTAKFSGASFRGKR